MKAFTLIELLVVIAIISLLVSILLPTLTHAKELARIAVCASNLHQTTVAVHLYGDDHDGHLPGPSGYRANCVSLFYQGAGDTYELYPTYCDTPGVFYCPAGPYQHDTPSEWQGAGPDETFFHHRSYGRWARDLSYDCYAGAQVYPGLYETVPKTLEDPGDWVIWTDHNAWYMPTGVYWQSNHPGNYGAFPERPPEHPDSLGTNVATMDAAVVWKYHEETKGQYPAFGHVGLWWARF